MRSKNGFVRGVGVFLATKGEWRRKNHEYPHVN